MLLAVGSHPETPENTAPTALNISAVAPLALIYAANLAAAYRTCFSRRDL
eukprot:CAMPEP_0115548632 /NCGR_PEP_ID=MMETSP0271-20121206/94264_1 /TAXON_ID=71861 /ORGANISM="Scrippsiella trochoidea, Strain CCMP3099" /LENGTH=49 /DNA_ID=CAMNT_0002982105 /DNA_START=100 /DNA_END=249 /DNA_ORIENTATION=+